MLTRRNFGTISMLRLHTWKEISYKITSFLLALSSQQAIHSQSQLFEWRVTAGLFLRLAVQKCTIKPHLLPLPCLGQKKTQFQKLRNVCLKKIFCVPFRQKCLASGTVLIHDWQISAKRWCKHKKINFSVQKIRKTLRMLNYSVTFVSTP